MSSSYDSIYKKMSVPPGPGGAGHAHEAKFDPARQISPAVAHELNNILTVIQSYASQLRLKHPENQELEANLQIISEAAHRATTVIRGAVPPEASLPVHPQPQSPASSPTE
jgi:hypothetical protein